MEAKNVMVIILCIILSVATIIAIIYGWKVKEEKRRDKEFQDLINKYNNSIKKQSIMNELKIQIPEGFQIGAFNKVTGVVKFEAKPKDIKERIKTFNDVLNYHGIEPETFAVECLSLTDDEIAYKQIKLIASALNEGWTPDWNDRNQTKYYPWFRMGSSSGGFSCRDYVYASSSSLVGSRLCFKNRDLAEYAGKQFESIYKEFMTI